MKEFKSIFIGGRGYTVQSPTIEQTKAVIEALKCINAENIDQVPDAAEKLCKAISVAICRNPAKAFMLRYRLRKLASLNELLEALNVVLSLIPVNEFLTTSDILNKLNKL